MKNRGVILVGIMLAMFLAALDQTIVATALPQITEQFNALSHLSWVFTAYMLASTITVPIYGKLSDIFGRKWLYIAGIGLFLIGSALSGLSQSMMQLIIFRGIQGIGGGAMMVNSTAIIGDLYAPAERGKYQGMLMAVFGLATIIGPLLGGWVTDSYSWRWIFYINVPVGIIAVAVISATLPKISYSQRKSHAVDYAGALLIAAGLIPLLLAFVWGGSQYAWGSWQEIMLFAVSAVIFAAFVFTEHKAKEPILALNLFRSRVFTVCIIIAFLTSLGMFGAILYIPVFSQGVIGSSATNSGIILMPMLIGLIVSSTLAGLLISRTGKYKILAVAGMIVVTVGMYLFTSLNASTTNMSLSLRMIFLGVGLGITMPLLTIAVQSAFGIARLGEVTAGSQLFRSIGGTVGTSILGGIMTSQLASRLVNVASDPFVALVSKLNPAAAITKMDANTIQGLLTASGQNQIQAMFAHAPASVQSQAAATFPSFLEKIKVAFSGSMSHVFWVGAIMMAVAFIAVFFLPEIPLRRQNRAAAAEKPLDEPVAETAIPAEIEDQEQY